MNKRFFSKSFFDSFITSSISLGLVWFAIGQAALADEKTVQRVLSEAPIGWQKIREFYDGTSFQVRTYRSKQLVELPKLVYVLAPNVRTEIIHEDENGKVFRKIEFFNTDYQASAIDNGTGSFALENADNRLSSNDSTGNGYVYKDAYSNLTVAGIYFPEAIIDFPDRDQTRSWGYKIKDAIESNDGLGNILVTLELKFVVKNSKGNFVDATAATDQQIVASKKCTLTLAPAREWAAVEFRDEQDRYFDGRVVPMIKFCRMEFLDETFHPSNKIEGFCPLGRENGAEVVFSYGEPAKATDVELNSNFFRLSSIGLPEPPQFVQQKSGWLFWIASFGIGFFVASIIWRTSRKLFNRSRPAATNGC